MGQRYLPRLDANLFTQALSTEHYINNLNQVENARVYQNFAKTV